MQAAKAVNLLLNMVLRESVMLKNLQILLQPESEKDSLKILVDRRKKLYSSNPDKYRDEKSKKLV